MSVREGVVSAICVAERAAPYAARGAAVAALVLALFMVMWGAGPLV